MAIAGLWRAYPDSVRFTACLGGACRKKVRSSSMQDTQTTWPGRLFSSKSNEAIDGLGSDLVADVRIDRSLSRRVVFRAYGCKEDSVSDGFEG